MDFDFDLFMFGVFFYALCDTTMMCHTIIFSVLFLKKQKIVFAVFPFFKLEFLNVIFVSPRRSQIIERFEDGQHVERMETNGSDPSANSVLRQGRSERRYLANKHVRSPLINPE